MMDGALMGAYRAAFRGRGATFDGVRPYEPGDDVRRIDWNVSARVGEPYVKQFTEERDLTVLVALDDSGSMGFGSTARTKRDLALELGAAAILIGLRGGDRVGVLALSGAGLRSQAPNRGRSHALHALNTLSAGQPTGEITLSALIDDCQRALKQRGVIFLLSDFLVDDDSLTQPLRRLSERHDVIACVVSDPLELALPDVGMLPLTDSERGQHFSADTASPAWRARYAERAQTLADARQRLLWRSGVDRIDITPESDPLAALAALLQRRASGGGRA
jgi:uncharacterized protein (DUF58 family)